MQVDKMKEAIDEARKFITKSELALKRIGANKYFYVSKETAACRRASMDLTRSLSELRK